MSERYNYYFEQYDGDSFIYDVQTNDKIEYLSTCADLLNEQDQKIKELEHRLSNCIEPKLIEGHKYFAVCSITKQENCPICNGNYRKMIIENNFKGELKCSNCDCGIVSKIEWKIIPFTLKYATYNKDGNVSYDNEVTIDCELDGYERFSGGLYLDDNSDYRSSWQYKICEEENCFATLEEAKAKLEELKK